MKISREKEKPLLAMIFLGAAAFLILSFEAQTNPNQVVYIITIYAVLAAFAKIYTAKNFT